MGCQIRHDEKPEACCWLPLQLATPACMYPFGFNSRNITGALLYFRATWFMRWMVGSSSSA
jgi:hypothetical protein